MLLLEEFAMNKTIFSFINVIFLIIIIAASNYVFLRGRRSHFLYYFLAAGVSLALWFTSLMLQPHSPDLLLRWLLVSLQYFAVFSTGYILLLAGISSYMAQTLPVRLVLPLALPFAISFLIALISPLNESIFISIGFAGQQTGSLYYPLLGLNYIFILIGLILGCISIARNIKNNRVGIFFLFAGIMLPAIISVVTAGEIFFGSRYLSPSFLTISLLTFAFSALKHHFFDIAPLARHIIINEISSPLIITRQDGRIIGFNHALTNIFNQPHPISHLMPVSELDLQLRLKDKNDSSSQTEITIDTAQGKRLFELDIQPFSGHGRTSGYVWRLLPLEQDQELRQIISRQNQQLEIANRELENYVKIVSDLHSMMVRNKLARELHDSLGHTIIILISVLERLLADPETGNDQELIDQARHLLQQARQQLPAADFAGKSANRGSKEHESQNLNDMIGKLSQDLSLGGIKLEKDLRGDISLIPQSHFADLIQICREAITNALKHGKADTVNIFILAAKDHYDLIILDNGQGSCSFDMGFGLRGIEQRAEMLGGNVRIQGDSSGFGVYVSIPLGKSTGQDDS